MDRRLAAGLAMAAALLVALPVAAHGNDVAVDSQFSDDGTVRVELVTLVADGFLALHADDGGAPGAVVGHRSFEEGTTRVGVTLSIDGGYWANRSGNLSLWAALHRDDGDGAFDPADDPILEASGGDALAERFVVRKATGTVNVVAEAEHVQEVNESRVHVGRVELSEPGHVVIRANASGGPGRVLGSTALGAGVHRGVVVDIDDAFYRRRPRFFPLWAVLHRDDGDGAFDASADRPFTAGGDPVMSRFQLQRAGDISNRPTATPAPTASPTETAVTAGTAPPTTATPTAAETDSPTASPTPSPTPTATAPPTPDRTATPGTEAPTTAVGTPGVGLLGGALSILLALLFRRRRG